MNVKLKELRSLVKCAFNQTPYKSSNPTIQEASDRFQEYFDPESANGGYPINLLLDEVISPILGIGAKVDRNNEDRMYSFYFTYTEQNREILRALMPFDFGVGETINIRGDKTREVYWLNLISAIWDVYLKMHQKAEQLITSKEGKLETKRFNLQLEWLRKNLEQNPQRIHLAKSAGGGGGGVYEEVIGFAERCAACSAGYVKVSEDLPSYGISSATNYYLVHPSLVKGEIRKKEFDMEPIYPEIEYEEI